MANPIRTSQLYTHGQGLKKLERDLIAAQKAYEDLVRKTEQDAGKLKQNLSGLSPNTGSGRRDIAAAAGQASKLERAQKKYNEALSDNAVELAKVKRATAEQNRIAKLQARLVTSVAGSYDALSAEYSLNKIELNKLSAAERENNEEAKALEEQTKAIFEEMKRLQEATGKTSLNVGNYTEAIQDAISGSLSFNGVLNLLSKNPIIGILTLVVGTLTALFKAFQRTERGAKLIVRIGGILEGVFSVLIGLVDKFAGFLIKSITEPRAAFNDFVDFLKAQLINRINGVIQAVTGLGKALFSLVQGNLKVFAEESRNAFDGAVQSITGLDKEMRSNLLSTITDTADAFGDLRVAQRELEIQTARLTVALARQNTEAQRLKEIADDDTRSFKERAQASEDAAAAEIRAARTGQSIARSRIALIDQELKLRRAQGEDVQELLKSRLEAQAELVGAEGELTLAILDNNQKRRKLIQDREELELDILIDGLNNQLAINKAIIDDDEMTFNTRANLLRRSVQISNDSFTDQIALIQKFTDARVDANALLEADDARVLFQRVRALGLSEILETRLLEIVRDRRDINETFTESQRKLSKSLEGAILSDNRFLDQVVLGNDGLRERVTLFSESSALGIKAAEENAKELETFLKAFRERIQPKDDDEPKSLLEMLGIDLNDAQLQALKSALDFVKSQFDSLAAKQLEIANQNVENADRRVENAQNALDTELQLAQLGQTANIEAAKTTLEEQKRVQAEALEDQRKAQAAQQNIETLQQASSLATAASNVLKIVPFPLNLFAVGTMLAAFTASKLRIRALTRRQLGKGDAWQVNDSGYHGSGNDKYIGEHNGKATYVEKDEVMGVFSRKAVRKNGARNLVNFVSAINGGALLDQQEIPISNLSAAYSITPASVVNMDTSGIEQRLDKANNKEQIVPLPNGAVMIKKGNQTQIIQGYGN